MVRSPLAHLTRAIPRKSLFKDPLNPYTPRSKRGIKVIRYAPAEFPKGPKKVHEVDWKLIPRAEHKIEWGGYLTMKYIDTHTHLHSTLQQMKDAPSNILDSFTIGAHPYNAAAYDNAVHNSFLKTLHHKQCVALGECGLDYFRTDSSTWPTQREVFIRQLGVAVFLRKPILVYTRDAERDTFSILHDHVPIDHKLHIQSFTGSREFGLKVLRHWPNSTLGITGTITYSGSYHVAEMIEEGEIPLNRMMLGSKSPFIVPKPIYPYIAKTTRPKLKTEKFALGHSGMLPIVAEVVAGLANKALKKDGKWVKDDFLHKMDSILKNSNEVAEKFFGIKV
ncbi:Metallo-dependent hydrolase [Tuber magnatum]|uniref:Metallo-dependent hydrolase n=1 Tax=Tuber magnatum TaxID=42249 RepID=A0A317SKM0_9PEZI|nr:Metallo-dependent hydrolase [Tuber magnatum]